jgi:hypothetical protein
MSELIDAIDKVIEWDWWDITIDCENWRDRKEFCNALDHLEELVKRHKNGTEVVGDD